MPDAPNWCRNSSPPSKGAAAHEENTLTAVVEARAKATAISVDASTITDPTKFQQAEKAQNGLSSALGKLMVIQEQYPNLKANENFLTRSRNWKAPATASPSPARTITKPPATIICR